MVYRLGEWESARIKRKRFGSREELGVDELYLQHFAGCGMGIELFREIIMEVAGALHFPVGKLRPGDRFDDELKPAHDFDQDNDDLYSRFVYRIRKRAGRQSAEIPDVKTLGEYVRALAGGDGGGGE